MEQESVPHLTSSRQELAAFRYLGIALLVCLIGYLLPFVVERVPALQGFSGSESSNVLDQSFQLPGTNADIVIFGDSSAIFGVDTPRLSQDLGLKVINLPNSLGNLVLMHDATLRAYLAHNTRPRLLVLHLAPWNLDFDRMPNREYEGQEQLVRHASIGEVAHSLETDPWLLAEFPFRFYSVPSRITRPFAHLATPRPESGFLPYVSKVPALAEGCSFPQWMMAADGRSTLEHLETTYRPLVGRILLILPPVPDCGGLHAFQLRFGADLVTLPPKAFADDSTYAHVEAAYSRQTTLRIEAILRERLRSNEGH